MDNFFVKHNQAISVLALVCAALHARPSEAQQLQVQRQIQVPPIDPNDFELGQEIQIETEPVTDEEFNLSLDPTAAKSADDLILKLGSPSFAEREQATAGLIEIGAPAFAKLRDAYRATPKLEVQLRIEHIVRTAYLNHHVFDRSGFLGINLQQYNSGSEERPRLPEGTVGVKIGKIIPNTAAERAGLQVEDVIFEVDGAPIEGEGMQVIENFSAMIRARGPGGKMNLTIMRGNQKLPLALTIGRCPENVAKEGNVRVVSENRYKAVARFPKWWAKFFLPQSAQGPVKISTETPTRVPPLR